MRRCGPRRPDSPRHTAPQGTAPPQANRSATAQPAHSLVPPHGPGHPAAPPAHGGHVHSSAPASSSRGSRRLHRAPARDSLSGSPQRRGPGAGKSAAALRALGPLATPPSPANQAAVAVATAWREGRRLTSTEPTLGALRKGLEKGEGEWVCDPQTKKGGDAEKGSLTTPKRKTSEEKEKKKPIYLSKKMKIRRTKICMLKLKTNEKVGDETFPPGTHERHGANSLINEDLLETNTVKTKPSQKNGQKGRKLAIHRKIQMADRPTGQNSRPDSQRNVKARARTSTV